MCCSKSGQKRLPQRVLNRHLDNFLAIILWDGLCLFLLPKSPSRHDSQDRLQLSAEFAPVTTYLILLTLFLEIYISAESYIADRLKTNHTKIHNLRGNCELPKQANIALIKSEDVGQYIVFMSQSNFR